MPCTKPIYYVLTAVDTCDVEDQSYKTMRLSRSIHTNIGREPNEYDIKTTSEHLQKRVNLQHLHLRYSCKDATRADVFTVILLSCLSKRVPSSTNEML